MISLQFAGAALFTWCGVLLSAQAFSAAQLVKLAGDGDVPALARAISSTFQADELSKGTAVVSEGGEFFWAVQAAEAPRLVVDDGPPVSVAAAGNGLFYQTMKLTAGRTHGFYYLMNGKPMGGRTDVAAYLPEAYSQPGVPKGTLSEKMVHTSSIYPGMKSDYWVYAPAQYDPKVPAAVMIWQDGEAQIERDGSSRTLNVIDNLTYQKKIPVMIQIFISPGTVGDEKMRSIEYDTVSDRYPRFLRDEILPEVSKRYNLRADGYSRGIGGESSGGICAFNAAWFMPDQFSRVITRIGSFTSIQWKTGAPDGGQDYPFKVRKEPKRNIRVWSQDGYNDLENTHGSWPLQNIQMANSLKMREYDFHFSFGNGTHTRLGGFAEAPTELIWLWRGYDPAKTAQDFQMESEEKSAPMFRVRLAPRD
jgi:enterochelin esterase family protein